MSFLLGFLDNFPNHRTITYLYLDGKNQDHCVQLPNLCDVGQQLLHCQICSVIISLASSHSIFLLFTYRIIITWTFAFSTSPSFLISLLYRTSPSSRSKSTCCWLFDLVAHQHFSVQQQTLLYFWRLLSVSISFYLMSSSSSGRWWRENKP